MYLTEFLYYDRVKNMLMDEPTLSLDIPAFKYSGI